MDCFKVRKALRLDAYQDGIIRMFGLHSDSIAMEMEVDGGARNHSLYWVGSAEVVSPLRKVEPKRVAVMWHGAVWICAGCPFLETQLHREAMSDGKIAML